MLWGKRGFSTREKEMLPDDVVFKKLAGKFGVRAVGYGTLDYHRLSAVGWHSEPTIGRKVIKSRPSLY